MLMNEGYPLKRVIVCSPKKEFFKVDNLAEHNIAEVAQPEKAKKEHEELKLIMKEFGAEIIDVEELEYHPNSVFTRDTCLCTNEGYIKLRMGLKTRLGEEEWMANNLKALGIPQLGQITPPGTVEGGDVILAGSVAFIGYSKRSNKEGVTQLSLILKKLGYEVRIATIPPPHFHIGGIMSLIGPEDVLYCRHLLDKDLCRGFKAITLNCRDFISGNVICLGNGQLVAEAQNEPAIDILLDNNFQVKVLSLTEFVKGQGGPTCLTLPVERGF